MSKTNDIIESDALKKEFSDADLALDVGSAADSRAEKSAADNAADDFTKTYPALRKDDPEPERGESSGKKRFLVANPDGFTAGIFDWIRCVLFAVAIVVVCLTFLFRMVQVDGKSMMDTLENADMVIVSDMFYQPHNNDIIVISHATNYNKPIIKRVIGIGGQTVRLDYDNDKIYVDGVELNEPYVKGTTFSGNGSKADNYLAADEEGNFVVPEGKLFVLGDNRLVSLDSRNPTIGLIDVTEVIGKAQFVVFPFNRFGNVYEK